MGRLTRGRDGAIGGDREEEVVESFELLDIGLLVGLELDALRETREGQRSAT